jgi:5-hydroxyisourate hydrolase
MPGLSIHVVDVSRGIVAQGMQVEVLALGSGGERMPIAAGRIGADGTLADPALSATFTPSEIEVLFHVGAFYRETGVALPALPFLDVVTYRFGIADPAQHYHLPFKCTPWGYSCFRGGA